MRFRHVGQADLKLLTSSDPPASASQSTGIIGMNHYAWLTIISGCFQQPLGAAGQVSPSCETEADSSLKWQIQLLVKPGLDLVSCLWSYALAYRHAAPCVIEIKQ